MARIPSTQDAVRRAALAGAPDRYCCVAGEQTAGRGRHGRAWVAPPGTALLASVLIRLEQSLLGGLPFAAAVAAIEALQTTCGVQAQLKWPNDVLVGGRKLAGILVEVVPGPGAAAVGMGMNLTVPSFPEGVAGVSLHELTTDPPDRDRLLHAWLAALDGQVRSLQSQGLTAVVRAWREHASGLGGPVTVHDGTHTVSGVAEGVADDGSLLVRTADGLQRVVAGDVTLPGGPLTRPASDAGQDSERTETGLS